MVLIYGHLRGKDFAKHKAALSKSNVTVGHRQQIATLSNGELRSKKDSSKTNENEEKNGDSVVNVGGSGVGGTGAVVEAAISATLLDFDYIEMILYSEVDYHLY